MTDDKPVDRRRFFRLGLGELLRPLASAVSPLERVADQLGKLDRPAPPPPSSAPAPAQPSNSSVPPALRKVTLGLWLRPPGALPELKFRETCSRCGECVRACPAQAIKLDPTGSMGNGAPYIDADTMPCVACASLACMNVCPSGALVLTPLVDIDMGTAVWREETCVRERGEDCTLCVDDCPLGTAAIELRDGRIEVKPLTCIGCGVCQNRCPTHPKSIYIVPVAAKRRRAE